MWLEQPSLAHKQSFLEAVNEFRAEGRPAQIEGADDFEEHVRLSLAHSRGEELGNLVSGTDFWMIDEDGFAGRVSIRHRLNEHLERFGGHMGYEVRPSKRRRGYATLAAHLALDEARKIGLERLLITCDETNVASRKIIEGIGGRLQDKVEWGTTRPATLRFWVELVQE